MTKKIPIIEIGRTHDRLIFTMEIAMPGTTVFRIVTQVDFPH